jgi:hypothetical protein
MFCSVSIGVRYFGVALYMPVNAHVFIVIVRYECWMICLAEESQSQELTSSASADSEKAVETTTGSKIKFGVVRVFPIFRQCSATLTRIYGSQITRIYGYQFFFVLTLYKSCYIFCLELTQKSLWNLYDILTFCWPYCCQDFFFIVHIPMTKQTQE